MKKRIKMYPNVEIGKKVKIEDYAVIGKPIACLKKYKLKTMIKSGSIIRSHSVIYEGNTIGKGFKSGHHAVIGPCNEIGDNCSVGGAFFAKRVCTYEK